MFLIRQVLGVAGAADAALLGEVQQILRARFPALSDTEIDKLPASLVRSRQANFQSVLFVAESAHQRLRGFALAKLAADLNFLYLDFLASAPGTSGTGTGGALYQRLREYAVQKGVTGIFMECLPDDPALAPDDAVRGQNIARFKFYERFGARPIINNDYATPVTLESSNPPYLVFDPLGAKHMPRRDVVQPIVRAILERKYPKLCPPAYVRKVVDSFTDDPIRLRAPRYIKRAAREAAPPRARQRIALIVNAGHDIHHVRERGYVQAPVRVRSILKELERSALFETRKPQRFNEQHIKAVHDAGFVDYLKHACRAVPEGKSVYPYVFPIRNQARQPRELPLRAGYYCIDTFTPINRNAWPAARGAVDCALTGTLELLAGRRLAYALVRPPGHHAERKSFGGFCYLNSNAAAAHFLSRYGKVAVLDIDYHHGNGTQDIFYLRSDVLTVSIHGHPRFTYPYFSGHEDETGAGEGTGFNRNYPLKEGLDGGEYRLVLTRALSRIRQFKPAYLVLALGLDTAKGDPTGSFTLTAKDFQENGRMIAALGLPTLVVQEGGYRTRTLGVNARQFFHGLASGNP